MMKGGVSLTISSSLSPQSSPFNFLTQKSICSNFQTPSLIIAANFTHNHLVSCPTPTLSLSSRSLSLSLKPIYCSPSPGSGDNDSKTILDAFFLGKALGEALTERIESAVGEVLSTIGRLQAEQQKQVLEFQEDVLERAKRAKEKAAREAVEGQGQGRLIPNSSTRNAAERYDTTSSAPTGVINPDEPGSIEDENRSGSNSLSSIEIDE